MKDRTTYFKELREHAENLLKGVEDEGLRPDLEIGKLFHELQVHQIELEMQNDELRETQTALTEALDKYTALYNFAPVGYFTFDQQGIIKEVNLTGCALLGIERKHLVGKPIMLYIQSEDELRFFEHLKRVFNSRKPQRCEVTLQRRDGVELVAQLESVVRQESGPQAKQCWTIITDMTEQKRMESALLKSEANLTAILNNSQNAFILFDTDATIQAFNSMAEVWTQHLLGKAMQVGDSMYAIFEGQEREEFTDGVSKALQGEIVNRDKRFASAEGHTYWFTVTYNPVVTGEGRVVGVCLGALEITQRKEIENALRQSEQFLQLTLNALSANIAILDETGTIVAVNAAWQRFGEANGLQWADYGIGRNYLEVCE
ncbi:PAS domain S-box protein, partial [candidate division KSB3 bacterium]|nr:PAS domain S-box protein [candidate division KSB3 bacterium]MBD3325732.1 PAS domain S-box protein [candidate division KSB3 bacterium]